MRIRSGKIDDLPEQYSVDLQKTIKMMLNLDQEKRPSIEEIISVPQISLRLREKKIKEHHSALKRKDEELKKKEVELDKRSKELDEKAKRLEEWEQKLLQMSKSKNCSNNSISYDEPSNVSAKDIESSSRKSDINKENISMNTTYSQAKIDKTISNLRNEFSEEEKFGNKYNFSSKKGQTDSAIPLTRASTTGISNKPPSLRQYYRDSSVGNKLRHNFSKERIIKKKKYCETKHDFTTYIQNKEQYTTRGKPINMSNNEFKPPRLSRERRNSYVDKKYIDES